MSLLCVLGYGRGVEFAGFLEQIAGHAAGLRAAAVAAGPAGLVPTCPGWTVHALVRHVAGVHGWAARALGTDPRAVDGPSVSPPEEWRDLLDWWAAELAALLDGLRSGGPDAPAWVFDAEDAPTMAFWARRQAHETAIHRLDAEHARAGAVPVAIFEPELAADGIDEALTLWVPRTPTPEPPVPEPPEGSVVFRATDLGRAWLVRLAPGVPPRTGAAGETGGDATVTGTADAVYRAVWGRPSAAVVSGSHALVEALRTP